jgi:hypothetical protein
MENLTDYSQYVFAAYGFALAVLGSLMLVVIAKYFFAKSKLKNAK